MKVLLIYPEYPATFWSFKHALPFINKKVALPTNCINSIFTFSSLNNIPTNNIYYKRHKGKELKVHVGDLIETGITA
ncbi:MAG: hypothetical protein NTV87_16890 [Ignavibacteriae bacterium]|jgi:hypothetical protein|nr:hypothetical protein [Ignavibacteriota bacterium]